jgi:molybdopterin-dependent oxidoreductase alpha subunit
MSDDTNKPAPPKKAKATALSADIDAPFRGAAGGVGAITSALNHAITEMGVIRSARALLRINQPGGFDCPGCAWPDPDPAHRPMMEFCENGAKAIADEATTKRITPSFFAQWSIPALLEQSEHWLGKQGRLTEPMWRPPGADHLQPITWDAAFTLLADALKAMPSPDAAAFYTSGRTSNEAAFLYQLFARALGTNNLPDCSNMCHESSGFGMKQAVGVGKGTVTLADFDLADCILIIGQNPGTNHPRMLTTLQAAARRGCAIISVNPLREPALLKFKHPQEVLGLLGSGTSISTHYLQPKINGDVALLKGLMKHLLALDAARPGQALDLAFLSAHTEGLDALRDDLHATPWEDIEHSAGLTRAEIEDTAEVLARSERVIACWAMGLTQHVNGVANVQSVVNLLLLMGQLGKPGAGLCPVRGHSNVQGDRTMGIWERPEDAFLDRLQAVFGFDPPRHHGLDVVATIEAMARGEVEVFLGMGGNFLSASPDTAYTDAALRRCKLTAHVATKLNRSHLVTGEQGLILPCLGRAERDLQAGAPQCVTVEDSMGVVHTSQGRLPPASDKLLSEPVIVARLALATLGDRAGIDWAHLVADYDRIRDLIEQVIPGFEQFNARVRAPGGFSLPNAVRDHLRFDVPGGKALLTVHPIPPTPDLGPHEYVMMTIRSHDQYNTTIYGLDDRYRGVIGERRVLLISPADMDAAGWARGQRVDVSSHYDGEARQLTQVIVTPLALPRRCVAMYFPEANALVPLSHRAVGSRTPASKSVVVRVQPSAT